ncbi:MAG TPA: acyl-CoA dehydrogenase family protein [Thermomicrobiales bacterium]|nr:acyl-CoA dehydrogenase family protein [Thermomicrobiales bacterium]
MSGNMIIPDFVQAAWDRFEERPATIQVDGADAGLPENARETRQKARAFAREVISPLARQIDEENVIPDEVWDALGSEGFFALAIPEEYGGRGSVLETCVAVEEISRVSASVGLLVSVGLLGPAGLVLAGTQDQKDHWLPRLAKGEFASFCLTEPGAGTDAASLRTSVEWTGDSYVLSGRKHYITGAGRSTIYTVFARSGDGPYEMTAMLVPAGTAGFSVNGRHPFSGIRGVPVGELDFDGVQLPEEARLGEPGRGFQLALSILDRARPGIASQALGLAQGALDAAFAYLGERVQFGAPLLDKDVIRHRLARHAASVAAARQLTYHAASLADAGSPHLNAVASMAKLVCTDLAMAVVTDAMQFWGGAGYMRGAPVERMYRDAKIMQIYEGTNEIQEMVISRALLREYRAQWSEERHE